MTMKSLGFILVLLYIVWPLGSSCSPLSSAGAHRSSVPLDVATNSPLRWRASMVSHTVAWWSVPELLRRAAEMYERVLYVDSDNLGAMCNYGLLLHSHPLCQWDDAEELYERVLARDPKHSTTLFNYANLQEIREDGKGGSASADLLYDEALRSTNAPVVDQTQTTEVSALVQ